MPDSKSNINDEIAKFRALFETPGPGQTELDVNLAGIKGELSLLDAIMAAVERLLNFIVNGSFEGAGRRLGK
jgi:hypothetical protein